MKNIIFYTLSLCSIFFFTACQPFSFDPPTSNTDCLAFMAQEPIIRADIKIHAQDKGYRFPRFIPGSNEDIVFLKTDVNDNQIIRLTIPSQQEASLLQTTQPIEAFDIGINGEIVIVSDGKIEVQLSPQSALQVIPFSGTVHQVKWFGQELIIMTHGPTLRRIDLGGQQMESFILPEVPNTHIYSQDFRWNLKDSLVIFPVQDVLTDSSKLYTYRLPGFQILDSLNLTGYRDLGETSSIISRNDISLAFGLANDIFFSRENRLYTADLLSQSVSILWERTDCQILEAGISLSADGTQLVLGAVQMLHNPELDSNGDGYKEYGILLIDTDGSNERWLFP